MKETALLEYLKGKRVMVTGGTGSFGRTFVSLCLENSRAKEIVIYSRDEQKHVALQRHFKDERVRSVTGDVRDLERLRFAMRGIDCVFNAAAIKHVHFTEQHPIEAVQTNIMGASRVCQAALECGVESLITLSTDKAVEPVNVMGMTKAIQERVVASYADKGMRVGIVRYGNVLASNGSIVPYFKELLEKGANFLPVTDRRMTRFVLTLEDSVHLVLHAFKHCTHGETFVLNLPAFKIWDLAQVMAHYASSKSKTVRIKEIGIRPGEKIHETLISTEEMRRADNRGRFWVIHPYKSEQELFAYGKEEKSLSSNKVSQLSKSEILTLLSRQGCLPKL